MKKEEFVKGLKQVTIETIVPDIKYVLEQMPLKSFPELKEISDWYKTLNPKEKNLLLALTKHVSQKSVFGVLAVIDGVRVIEDSEIKGEFQLYYVREKEMNLINSPKGEYLHDLL